MEQAIKVGARYDIVETRKKKCGGHFCSRARGAMPMGGPPTHHHREVEQPVITSLLDRVDHAHSLNGLLVQHVPRDMGASVCSPYAQI